MYRLFGVACAAFLSLSAAAQTTTEYTWLPLQLNFNAADCDATDEIQLRWVIESGTNTEKDIYVRYQPDGNCYALSVVEGENIFSATTSLSSVRTTIDPVFPKKTFMPPSVCADAVRNRQGSYCFYIYNLGRLDEAGLLDVVQRDVFFDTEAPLAASIEDLSAADGTLSFRVGGQVASDDIETFQVELRACGAGDVPSAFAQPDVTDGGPIADAGSEGDVVPFASTCGAEVDFIRVDFSNENISLSGFSDGAEYEMRVRAVDDFGNIGAYSDVTVFAPQEELGGLGVYEGAGTPYGFTPDCQSGGHIAWLSALFLLLLFVRRRKSILPLTLLFVAAPALAAPGQMTAEIFVSPYQPGLDREASAGGFYKCVFEDAVLPEFGGATDVHLFDGFGSLQLGAAFTVAQATGLTFPVDFDASNKEAACKSPSGGRSQLTMLRLAPRLSYRFDWLLDEFGVPLVPYGHVSISGVGFAFTRNRKFDTAKSAKGIHPMGVVFGYEAALGMMVELAFLDAIDPFTPHTVRRARAQGSFLHPFFFVEAAYSQVDNFGGGGFDFSPNDVLLQTDIPWAARFGLAIEFP